MFGQALAAPLEQIMRTASQTPALVHLKSKIPVPEKFNGKKGNTAKAFLLECKPYFISKPPAFPPTTLESWPLWMQFDLDWLEELLDLTSANKPI
ncbi:hypothetical protein FRC12_004164 [Ceratobasidium sp. 428]|nr:hypothetical protein FRC12_004164 [Ceratobasidium sp. 428]